MSSRDVRGHHRGVTIGLAGIVAVAVVGVIGILQNDTVDESLATFAAQPASPSESCPAEVAEGATVAEAVMGSIEAADEPAVALGFSDGSVATPEGELEESATGTYLHSATTEEDTTVAVVDTPGADSLIIAGDPSAGTYESDGELVAPDVADTGVAVIEVTDGGAELLILDETLQVDASHPAPEGTTALLWPTWSSATSTIVVVEEPIGYASEVPPELDAAELAHLAEFSNQSNLWSVDHTTGEWARLTDFTAGADLWVTAHSPVVNADGSVDFVLISGVGSGGSGDVTHERWRLVPGQAPTKVGDLALGTFLVGPDPDSGEMLATQIDLSTGTWSTGELVDGDLAADAVCGAARINGADKDPDAAHAAPPESPPPTETPSARLNSVVIGPFASEADATDALAGLTGTWAVLDDGSSAGVVPAGTWAVVRLDVAAPISQETVDGLMVAFELASSEFGEVEGIAVGVASFPEFVFND